MPTLKKEYPTVTMELPQLLALMREIETDSRRDSTWNSHKESGDWNGNMSMMQVNNALEFGWQDAPSIPQVTIPNAPNFIQDIDYSFDVTGSILDVASYVTGVPDHWMNPEYVERPADNILKLSIEIGGNWTITTNELTNRGQAVIALINSLETSGLSVELTLVNSWISKRGIGYTVIIPIKKAGEALDMNRIQLMLSCPAFYRRCILGMHEWFHGSALCVNNSYQRRSPLAGCVHISWREGLTETLAESMEWANSFGRTMVDAMSTTV